MMPKGIRKQASAVLRPVVAVIVAAPPRSNMAVTKTLVRRQKKRNTW